MKHLRQYIRQILLTEGMKTPDMLPDDVAISVDEKSYPGVIVIRYVIRDDMNPSRFEQLRPNDDYPVRDKMGVPIHGRISITRPAEYQGPCDGAMKVDVSKAADGWGPLLYDLAMEYATLRGSGLFADRDSVSGPAREVWKYYMENRGDVTGIQMDDLENTLTPEDEDNCDQDVSKAGPGQRGRDYQDTDIDQSWIDSPLSKRWTKEPTQMEKLRSLGKLVEL